MDCRILWNFLEWNHLFFFLKSLKQAKENGQLRFSQCQTVIKLIEKKIEIKGTLKIGDQYHYLRFIWKLSQKLSPLKLINGSDSNFFESNWLC